MSALILRQIPEIDRRALDTSITLAAGAEGAIESRVKIVGARKIDDWASRRTYLGLQAEGWGTKEG